MSFSDRIRALPTADLSDRVPFVADGVTVGYVTPAFASSLGEFADVFQLGPRGLALHPALDTYDKRTRRVNDVLKVLRERGAVPHWRNENYRVSASFHAPAAFEMERAAATLFGITAYGVHLNGFVRDKHSLSMWIGRRSRSAAVEPGKLDQLVAGGLPAKLTISENLAKEASEEASIPADLVAQAKPAGTVSYCTDWQGGLKRDVLFVFDLELPPDFVPCNSDGELDAFTLLPIADVMATARETADFKFNCSLVVIDFLIRHGVIGPDEPDYTELVRGLHR
jgi:8-oxo-dGTP pyrophosphatase MutT (NUDIX family)